MDKQEKQQIRLKVWQKLKNVALPDSRFHLNFEEYIPDFKDSVMLMIKLLKVKNTRNQSYYSLPLIIA